MNEYSQWLTEQAQKYELELDRPRDFQQYIQDVFTNQPRFGSQEDFEAVYFGFEDEDYGFARNNADLFNRYRKNYDTAMVQAMASSATNESVFDLATGEDENSGISFGGQPIPSAQELAQKENWRGYEVNGIRVLLDYTGETDNSDLGDLVEFNQRRYAGIRNSLKDAPQDYTGRDTGQFFVGDWDLQGSGQGGSGLVAETQNLKSKLGNAYTRTVYRDPSTGRFSKSAGLAGLTSGLRDDVLQTIGERLRQMFVENYAQLPIGQGGGFQTGTLKQAVEQSEIAVDRLPGTGFVVKVQLADLERPARPGDQEGVSTRFYGPLVFRGRRAIQAKSSEAMMKFQIGRPLEWITARTVRASRTDLDIYQLSAAQIDELQGLVASAVKGSLHAQIAG